MTRARAELERRGEFEDWHHAVQLPAVDSGTVLTGLLQWLADTGRRFEDPFDEETRAKRDELQIDAHRLSLQQLAIQSGVSTSDLRLVTDVVPVEWLLRADVVIVRGDENALTLQAQGRFVHDLRGSGFLT